MSSRRRKNQKNRARANERRFTIRGERRDPVDITKFSKALIGLAQAEAERQAQAEHAARGKSAGKAEVTDQETEQAEGGGHVTQQ